MKYSFLSLFLLLPHLALACGGGSFGFASWAPFLPLALVVFHGYFFFLLNGSRSLNEKVQTARRYAYANFNIHVSIPVIITLIYALVFTVAYACIDLRSPQERFADDVIARMLFPWLFLALVSIASLVPLTSRSLSLERKVVIGRRIAGSLLFVMTLITTFLSYSLWMVAPSLSDKRPFDNMPPPSN
jgi:hypothetical protein